MTGISGEIGGKNLELVREVVPTAGRVGVLVNVPDPFHKPFLETIQASGRILGIEIRPLMVMGLEQLDAAFADIAKERLPAVIVQPSLPHKRVIELALKQRLPTIAPNADYAMAGGLMSYSADQLVLAVRPPRSSTRFSKAANPPTYQCNCRQNSCWSSI